MNTGQNDAKETSGGWKIVTVSPDAFRELLNEEPLEDVVRAHVLTGAPEAFADEPWLLGDLQRYVQDRLKVPADATRLVGSGHMGYSISPDTFPRDFGEHSDLDLVVVSAQLFDSVWATIRGWAHPRRYKLPRTEAEWLQEREAEIFWGWLDPARLIVPRFLQFPQKLAPLRDFAVQWTSMLRSTADHFEGTIIARHELSGRLYRTESHLIDYQTESLRRLRSRLSNSP